MHRNRSDFDSAMRRLESSHPRHITQVHSAPNFLAIAHTPGMTAAGLVHGLPPHHSMPYLILSGQQVRDVSAYILSLQD